MIKNTMVAVIFSLASMCVYAIEPIYSKNGKAIKGYDPVAYFVQNAPTPGLDEFTYQWQGANWFFASQENKDLFVANPEKYAPQYGGYCAYAAAQGEVAKINPDSWAIVDGKLYLNYNTWIQRKWDKSRAEYIEAADHEWPGVLDGQ